MNIPDNSNLKDKVVVLTGGAGVLGTTFAWALAKANAKVAILDLNEELATKLANEIKQEGLEAIGVKCNVLQLDSIKAAKDDVLNAYGKIDILINGAGGNHPKGTTGHEFFDKKDLDSDVKTFFDLDPEGIRFVFDLNFIGTLLPTPRTGTPCMVLIHTAA